MARCNKHRNKQRNKNKRMFVKNSFGFGRSFSCVGEKPPKESGESGAEKFMES